MRSTRAGQVPWTGGVLQSCPQGQTAGVEGWQALPLCWRYASAHLEEQRVQVRVDGWASTELTVIWAVGALADGDWEALGSGAGTAVGPGFWRGVWEDLNGRGVDKISLVCASDIYARTLCEAVKVLPPFRQILGQGYGPAASDVGVLRVEARRAVREASGVRAARIALERLLARSAAGRVAELAPDWPDALTQLEAFYALSPRRRSVVRRGDEAAEHLGRSLSQAVGRHGAFPDPAAATSFVAETLAHAERRLKASAFVGPDISVHRAAPSVSASGSGLAGRGI